MLETIRRIVQEVTAAENLEQALETIVTRVKQVIDCNVCSIYLGIQGGDYYLLMATRGLNPEAVGRARLERNEGLVGLVAQRAEPVNLEDAHSHPRYKFLPDIGEEAFHGFLGVPIIHHRKILGVLVVQQRENRRFDENEETLLVTLAAQLSGAIALAEASGSLRDIQGDNGERAIHGLPGAPGVSIGQAVIVYPAADLDAVPRRRCRNIDEEIGVFTKAVEAVREEVRQHREQLAHLPTEERALFDAYLMMLQSNSLIQKTIDRIKQGFMASTALRDTVQEQTQLFASMDDDYLAERVLDIRDLARRILVRIQSKTPGTRHYPPRTILVGDELTAADLMAVPRKQLAGVLSRQGSGSSHVAILARALGIPAVMGASELPGNDIEGLELVLDGYQGWVYLHAGQRILSEYRRLMREEAQLSANLQALCQKPAKTLDGCIVPLYINSGLLSDIGAAANSGADGIGLYRTEFPFMIRDRFPGEEEQCQIYRQILQAFAPRPVTLRTLDIGGDKTLPYFPIREDNPFLGWRGIRVSLDHPDIFATQIRAMLRANAGLNNLQILLPMISTLNEVDEALAIIERARKELASDGYGELPCPRTGVMIEVPSAVYQAAAIARRVDFLSIGTNDLTQYLLAVDRNNPNVAELYDSLHPAVIHAVYQTTRAAHRQNIPVSTCGEMAGDPLASLLLLGMGMDSLSMSVVALPRVKWVIRSFTRAQATALLDEVLRLEDPATIRALLGSELDRAGLGSLIRPGK